MSIRNLKTLLILDAVICSGVFVIGLLVAAPAGRLLGLPESIIVIGGWICLSAALIMLAAARQAVPGGALVKLIALGNLGWVAASLGVVATFAGQMTAPGIAVVIVQAIGVLVFAIYEARGASALPRPATV